MSDYNEDSIVGLEGLYYVRKRITAFFHSVGIEGLVHQANELITNAIDEIALMPTLQGELVVLLCIDNERNTYQMVIRDNGRGLPVGKLVDAYTKLGFSGKFDTKAYEHSGGLFGQGAKGSAGGSKHFRSISHRPDRTGSLYIQDCQVQNGGPTIVDGAHGSTGVMVIYEPSSEVFPTDIPLFQNDGQAQILLLLQKYCFFRRLKIRFCVYPLGLPETIWTEETSKAEMIVNTIIDSSVVAFDEEHFDRTAWIRGYWNLLRPFSLQHQIEDVVPAIVDNEPTTMRYQVKFYTAKFDTIGGRFGMINNLSIDDAKSTHFQVVNDVLKVFIAPLIKEAPIRKYFIDSYRMAIYLAIDVKYPGAQPSGTTKHAFMSRAFRNIYAPSVEEQIKKPEGMVFIEHLYAELATDIENRYNAEVNGVVKIKNQNRLFEQFDGLSKRFKDCLTNNRHEAELFLVEGKSAGGGADGCDSNTQGMYFLRGKPLNAITTEENRQISAMKLRDNSVYKEIIAIMRLTPAKFDRNSLYFARMNILCDADDHGQHISSLVVSNFYVLCPELVESGIIHVVTPPLYSLEYTDKKQKVPKIYHRDENALQIWMAENIYLKALTIGIRNRYTGNKTHPITGKQGVDFLRLILTIGEAITNLAGELVLEEDIIEKLTYVTQYLSLNEHGLIDTARISQLLGISRVTYDPEGHILILSLDKTDYIIPLQNVQKRLTELVLPLLNRMWWKTTQIYITTNHTAQFRDQPLSIMSLYRILKTLDDRFKIERYKGLGSMESEDRGRTCLHPEMRNSYQIFSVGDVKTVFNLLGNDSSHRKQMLRQ